MQTIKAVGNFVILSFLIMIFGATSLFAATPKDANSFGSVVFFGPHSMDKNEVYQYGQSEKIAINGGEFFKIEFPLGKQTINFGTESWSYETIKLSKKVNIVAGETIYLKFESRLRIEGGQGTENELWVDADIVAAYKFPQGLKDLGLYAFNGSGNDTVVRKETAPPANVAQVKNIPTPKANTFTLFKTNRQAVAVIIGNQIYSENNKDIPNVDYAHNDAEAIFKYVTQALGYRESNVIFLKDATQADLVSAFGNGRSEKANFSAGSDPTNQTFSYFTPVTAPQGSPTVRATCCQLTQTP